MQRRVLLRRGDSEEDDEDCESLSLASRKSSSTGSMECLNKPTDRNLPSKPEFRANVFLRNFFFLSLFGLFVWITFLYTRHPQLASVDRSFVSVEGTRFFKDCRAFYVVGFNAHDATTAALLHPSQYRLIGGKSGKTHVKNMFQKASAAGLNVARIWVHPQDPKFPFQVSPGEYNEEAFRALDFVISEAGRNGLKVVLSVIDTWKYYNGVDQFVDWSSTAAPRNRTRPTDQWGDALHSLRHADPDTQSYEAHRRSLFFSDSDCKRLYKAHLQKIVMRRNSVNGRVYREDPVIMAWDLLNEPRCETWVVADCARYLQEWIEEMSSYLKSLDSKHLVTIGSEGFYGVNSTWQDSNPQNWGVELGQDFVTNHLPRDIDFATVHIWPNNWNRSDIEFGKSWIQHHMELVTSILQKPLLVEEFGRKLTRNERAKKNIKQLRDPIFQSMYELIERWILEGKQAVGGSLFWRWKLSIFDGSREDEYEVDSEDSTFHIIKAHAASVKNLMISQAAPCQGNCWVKTSGFFSDSCRNLPQVCFSFLSRPTHELNGNHTTLQKEFKTSFSQIGMYSSKRQCCQSSENTFSLSCFA